MDEDVVLTRLFAVLDALGEIARMMHPGRLPELISKLGDRDISLRAMIEDLNQQSRSEVGEQIILAGMLTLQASAGLRAAPAAANPVMEVYRAMRQYSRAQEALAALMDTVPRISEYWLEPRMRNDAVSRQRMTQPPHPDSGTFHYDNQTNQRGGFSVYVPPWYDPAHPAPLIMALHGGSGHGRLFLWNWVPEARSRGMIVIAPTAIGSTWSLMEPETDGHQLEAIVTRARDRWNIDAQHMLLCGMSDGGTFTLLSGTTDLSPFTHLAPVAASFHPLLLAMTSPRRLTGLPIHLTHGAQDWMFPVDVARTAHRALTAAGAAITYREIADLSHAYPRDRQNEVLDWFMAS